MTLEAAEAQVRSLPAEIREQLIAATGAWAPLPGPQTEAYLSLADILFYGGAAGGGKTDLLLGVALNEHQRACIWRRESPQLQGITDRMNEIRPDARDHFHSQKGIWTFPGGPQIELGSCPHVGNETRYQGRPHDLKGFDEICHFTEGQFRFLIGWLRSTTPGQRKRVVCTGNPPTRPEERWVIDFWGPWLKKDHPNPAKPGELRYFYTDPETGRDTEHPDGVPFFHEESGEVVLPLSRTFISSEIDDNPFLARSGYRSVLQGLPEPLRSQLLKGNFYAGLQDHERQVIPTAWVQAAMDRWKPRDDKGQMTAVGVDPNRGGADKLGLSRRHGSWFDEILTYSGAEVPDGPAAASIVVQHLRGACPINVDVIGYGSSCVDFLTGLGLNVNAMNGSAGSSLVDKTGRLKFYNLRTKWYWELREMLDPANTEPVALPPDSALLAELCAPRYTVKTSGSGSGLTATIQVESKDELLKPSRLGRSPDMADALVYASADMENWGTYPAGSRMGGPRDIISQRTRPESAKRGQSRPVGGDWNRSLDYSNIDRGIV